MFNRKWIMAMVLGLMSGLASAEELARSQYNMPIGVTEISKEVHGLHMLILGVVTVIAILVFGAMMYSLVAHRRSKNPKPADFHHSTLVEIIWTGIPFIILVGMAIPAAATLIKMEDTSNADMTIKVTGFQWGWKYEYMGQDVAFTSMLAPESNAARQLGAAKSPEELAKVDGGNYLWEVTQPLVLPVGKKVRFLLTSEDVIHAWWVFDLAVKKDAIPGIVNETWTKVEKPGIYRGVCAELCGRDHGFMPVVVKAVPETEYLQWLAGKKGVDVETLTAKPAPMAVAAALEAAPVAAVAPAAEPAAPAVEAAAPTEVAGAAAVSTKPMDKSALMAAGKKVYEANCQACHQPEGKGLPPSFPALVGSKVANGPAAAQITQILKGKGVMPPFASLSDADIAAVATYTRQSWGNKGSVVQPADVKAAR